jgi:tripartite-type tricarboxylate transporter receptor subunit TctC
MSSATLRRSQVSPAPNVLEVSLSVPVKTVPEFIAYAKANPGKLNMASTGVGTSPHVSGELFKMMTGVNLVHVPYRGAAAAITDMLSGQVQVFFDNLPSSIEHIKAGKLRALAVTTTTRSDALPDLPTVGEFVPGYEATPSWGVGVPKNTPAEIIDKLNKEINAGLADPKMTARIVDLGATVLAGTPAEFGKLIADETEKWGKVVKFAGIKGGLSQGPRPTFHKTRCANAPSSRTKRLPGFARRSVINFPTAWGTFRRLAASASRSAASTGVGAGQRGLLHQGHALRT